MVVLQLTCVTTMTLPARVGGDHRGSSLIGRSAAPPLAPFLFKQ